MTYVSTGTRINDILGYRESRIKSAVENFYGFKKATIQEQLVQLDTRIDWGNRFARQAAEDPDMSLADRIRRYEQALTAFERARETIKYMPPEVDVDEQQPHRAIGRRLRLSCQCVFQNREPRPDAFPRRKPIRERRVPVSVAR